jgi:hypothetical protein
MEEVTFTFMKRVMRCIVVGNENEVARYLKPAQLNKYINTWYSKQRK